MDALPVKAFIFDADGVIINAERFSERYARDFSVPNETMLPFFTGTFQDCLVGKADLKKEIAKHLPEWNWKGSADEFLDYWFRAEHKIDQELVDCIKDLRAKGIVCCLATNQEKYRTEYILHRMGFDRVFDRIYSSARIGHKKPDNRFFRHIIDDLKLRPEEIMVWDDTPGHIESAIAIGLMGHVYTTFPDFMVALRDIHVV